MIKINLHKIYFGILFLLIITVPVFELHYLLYLITIFLYSNKLSIKTIEIASILFLILLIAITSSINSNVEFYNWLKDFTYFSKPLLALLAGYFISKQIGSFNSVNKIIIVISTILAIIHVSKIFIFVDFGSASVSDIRRIGGISNEIEIYSIVILLLSNKYSTLKIFKNKLFKNISLIVLISSSLLYLSRTMFVTFIIFLLAGYGYLKLTKKGIKYLSIVILSFSLFYIYLFSINLERDKPGIESFLYKMRNAPAEIFKPAKSINVKDHATLWDSWRAYEANMAINQLNSVKEYIFGKGLGSLVDLKFAAPLGDRNMRYIPILHNGYVNVIFKAGFLGFCVYLLFLLNLYLFTYKINSKSNTIATNLVGGFGVFFFFSSLIVTGIYNIMETFVFVLGMLLYFSTLKNKIS